jgi:acetyl-CoA acetyltransferase family protein
MGETAERVAEQFKIARSDQDEFALASHQKTSAAYEAGVYRDQILDMSELVTDESLRSNIALESLAKLTPAFLSDGSVTAGNSSPLSDGAAALMLASSMACERYGLKPVARYVASGNVGVDPAIMGIGPVSATRKALAKSGWGVGDIDHFEINEAFAAQVLAVQRELAIPTEKLNVDGGAIAIGHPLGASGIRLALTAISRMAREKSAKRAVLSACIGVGQGETIVLESVL